MHYEAGEEFTYGMLKETVNRLADALYNKGLRKGDVVCVYCTKHIAGCVSVLAVLELGAIVTPCRPSHTAGCSKIFHNDARTVLLYRQTVNSALWSAALFVL